MTSLLIFIDATVQPHGAGLGVALKDGDGRLIGWRGKPMPPMTINEAEYEALLFALDLAGQRGARHVRVFSDSRVVVEQMSGAIRVHHDSLKRLHQRATAAVLRFTAVSFTHIPRELNVLADAMAAEAMLRGRLRKVIGPFTTKPEGATSCSSS
jgi:ribonuclease HI